MEMERVPAAGYDIKGLPVCGFDRKHLLRNVKVLMKLWKSIRLANQILKDFKPDIAIGVGGYASGPMLKAAQKKGIPTLLQEQNSYAGVTNKLLAKGAKCICVAYEGMERFSLPKKLCSQAIRCAEIYWNVRRRQKMQKRRWASTPTRLPC